MQVMSKYQTHLVCINGKCDDLLAKESCVCLFWKILPGTFTFFWLTVFQFANITFLILWLCANFHFISKSCTFKKKSQHQIYSDSPEVSLFPLRVWVNWHSAGYPLSNLTSTGEWRMRCKCIPLHASWIVHDKIIVNCFMNLSV